MGHVIGYCTPPTPRRPRAQPLNGARAPERAVPRPDGGVASTRAGVVPPEEVGWPPMGGLAAAAVPREVLGLEAAGNGGDDGSGLLDGAPARAMDLRHHGLGWPWRWGCWWGFTR